MFSIARALIQIPSIIMFSIPFGILGKFDYEKFNAYMDKIKKDFHVILIFHGPEEIISNCDKILTVSENTTRVKPLKGYIEELPQLGEVITIELAHPQDITINKLRAMSEIDTIIEERKAEKYKLFLKDEINSTLIKITELFGSSLYSFKRSKASIKDYLEFMEFRNYNLKTI